MKKLALFALVILCNIANAQNDTEGCKDPELFPTRLPGYFIEVCENNEFSSHVVMVAGVEKTVEGKKRV